MSQLSDRLESLAGFGPYDPYMADLAAMARNLEASNQRNEDTAESYRHLAEKWKARSEELTVKLHEARTVARHWYLPAERDAIFAKWDAEQQKGS